ncbi:MAG: radical SAM/SPASM domain-containing protein [archaeon]
MSDSLYGILKQGLKSPYQFLLDNISEKSQNRLKILKFSLESLLLHGSSDSFLYVEIEKNTECNRRCDYCPNSLFPPGKEYMEMDLFKNIINQLRKMDYKGWLVTHRYGEPLLDPTIEESLIYVHEHLPKAKVKIYTNGDYLDIETFDRLSPYVQTFVVTQHGRTIPDSLRQVLEDPEKNKKIDFQQNLAEKKLMNRGGLVNVDNLDIIDPCFIGPFRLVIKYNGDVILCCNDYFGDYVFGNVNQEKILDIWNKPGYKDLRKQLKKGIFKEEICKKCVGQVSAEPILLETLVNK